MAVIVSEQPSREPSRWSELIRAEDYWAIWVGFIIIFGALLKWIPKIPKVGNWTTNPLDAFISGDTTILIPLLILMIGLGILTAIGISFMKTDKFLSYLWGFFGVFVLATISYWVATR